MSIILENVTKRFGDQTAVNNISFSAESRGVIGFLGPNGAGKSTTMKMITGYWTADEGKIQVCGLDISANRSETKKMIGYLPEGNPLYYDMHVREYLGFIASVQKTPDFKERIGTVIQQTGLQRESGKKIGQLSKGYKQRVGLAAAILNNPEVLILDEPTSGLDPNQIIEIRDLISHLGETKTILFSSHILQEVESICKRVIVINKGNLVADDTIDNLKSKGASVSVVSVRLNPLPVEEWYREFSLANGMKAVDDEFHIETADPDGLKKQIIQYSLKNNLNIVSLDSYTNSLEDIFKELTK